MKNLIIGIMLLACVVSACKRPQFTQAQIDKSAKQVYENTASAQEALDTFKHVKKALKLPTDTSRIYETPRGAHYYWRISKKSGKSYKCYIKRES